MSRKVLPILGLLMSVMTAVSLSVSTVRAESKPPAPVSPGMYTASQNADGGYKAYFNIINNPGIFTTFSSFSHGTLNPLAFTQDQLKNSATGNLRGILTDSYIKDLFSLNLFNDVYGCFFYVGDVKQANVVLTAASRLFSLSNNEILVLNVTPTDVPDVGNYYGGWRCDMLDGEVIGDSNEVYVVSPFSTPAPKQNSYTYNSPTNSTDGFITGFNLGNNPGIVSSTYQAAAAIPKGSSLVLAPLAITNDQISSEGINLYLTVPSWLQSAWQSVTSWIGGLFGGGGKPQISDCSFNVKNIDTGATSYNKQYSSSDISGWGYVNTGNWFSQFYSSNAAGTRVSIPSSLAPGNYKLSFGCDLTDSNHIEDFNYIYIPSSYQTSKVTVQTLFVSLVASPSSLTLPVGGGSVSTSLTATVSGTATGSIHYQFDCTNNGGYEVDVLNNNNATCSYQTAGTYTARVHAQRGTATADDTTTITVNPPPAAPGQPAVDIKVQ